MATTKTPDATKATPQQLATLEKMGYKIEEDCATLREKYSILLDFAKYAELWARNHDYAFRLKAIEILKKLGEWGN